MAANETSHPIIAPSTTKEGRHFIGANHPDSDAISKCFIHWHSRIIPQRHAAISSCTSPIRPIQFQPSSRFPGSPIAQHGPFGKDRRRIKAQWLFTGSPRCILVGSSLPLDRSICWHDPRASGTPGPAPPGRPRQGALPAPSPMNPQKPGPAPGGPQLDESKVHLLSETRTIHR